MNDLTSTDLRPRAVEAAHRLVYVEVMSTMGWLYGTLHVPADQPLVEFLAQSGPSFTLTNVRVPKEPDPVRFLALRRGAVTLVAPSVPSELVEPIHRDGSTHGRQITCFLQDGIVRGTVEVPTDLRLSDHLRREADFLVLRRSMLTSYGETLHSAATRTLSAAIINLARVAGVSE